MRVRLRSSHPLASNSLLQIPKKFSSSTISPLKLLLELPLLPLSLPPPPPAKFFSTGNTAAMFQTSLRTLAFNVAAHVKLQIQATSNILNKSIENPQKESHVETNRCISYLYKRIQRHIHTFDSKSSVSKIFAAVISLWIILL